MPSPAPEKIPQHVAIIMDGNGRWAQTRGLPRLEGHRRGVETVRTIVDAARELGIRYLTLYAFSVENYGARTELADAAKHYTSAVLAGTEKLAECSWENISRYLYTSAIPDPDLLIRTSGEQRVSNFLLLQCAYAELVFTPVLWPDFQKADLQLAITEYAQRERRYGLTSEQIKTGPR
jgi:undecaprenyl diphosphate synthase